MIPLMDPGYFFTGLPDLVMQFSENVRTLIEEELVCEIYKWLVKIRSAFFQQSYQAHPPGISSCATSCVPAGIGAALSSMKLSASRYYPWVVSTLAHLVMAASVCNTLWPETGSTN
jgi:hypothetical protein